MFPPNSIEVRLAVALCVVVPYLVMFLMYRRGKLWPLNFRVSLSVFVLFVASFMLILIFTSSLLRYYPSEMFSLGHLIFDSIFNSIVIFPGFPVLIIPFFLGLLSWKSDARYLFIGLSGLGHLFYLINVVMFMLSIDLIKI